MKIFFDTIKIKQTRNFDLKNIFFSFWLRLFVILWFLSLKLIYFISSNSKAYFIVLFRRKSSTFLLNHIYIFFIQMIGIYVHSWHFIMFIHKCSSPKFMLICLYQHSSWRNRGGSWMKFIFDYLYKKKGKMVLLTLFRLCDKV